MGRKVWERAGMVGMVEKTGFVGNGRKVFQVHSSSFKGDGAELTNRHEERAERLPLLCRVLQVKEGYHRPPRHDDGVLSECVLVICFGHVLCYGSVTPLQVRIGP
jgi:hypothetical protein